MRSMLYEVSPADPATFAVVSAALIAVALLACWIPAAGAARMDPLAALRQD
jgi:ABC-type antimicrobial peptide transport system permease subunit